MSVCCVCVCVCMYIHAICIHSLSIINNINNNNNNNTLLFSLHSLINSHVPLVMRRSINNDGCVKPLSVSPTIYRRRHKTSMQLGRCFGFLILNYMPHKSDYKVVSSKLDVNIWSNQTLPNNICNL